MKILLLGSFAAMLLLSLSHGQEQPALVVDSDDGDDAVPFNLQAHRELKRNLQNDDIKDDGNLQMDLRSLRDEYADNSMPEIQMALRGLEDRSDDDNSMPEIQMALRGLEDRKDDDNSMTDKHMALRGLEDGDDDDNIVPDKQVALRQLDSAGAVDVTAPRKRFFSSLISKGIKGIFRLFRRRSKIGKYIRKAYKVYKVTRHYRRYRRCRYCASYRYWRPRC